MSPGRKSRCGRALPERPRGSRIGEAHLGGGVAVEGGCAGRHRGDSGPRAWDARYSLADGAEALGARGDRGAAGQPSHGDGRTTARSTPASPRTRSTFGARGACRGGSASAFTGGARARQKAARRTRCVWGAVPRAGATDSRARWRARGADGGRRGEGDVGTLARSGRRGRARSAGRATLEHGLATTSGRSGGGSRRRRPGGFERNRAKLESRPRLATPAVGVESDRGSHGGKDPSG